MSTEQDQPEPSVEEQASGEISDEKLEDASGGLLSPAKLQLRVSPKVSARLVDKSAEKIVLGVRAGRI